MIDLETKRMIQSICWRYHRSTGINWDDLYGEAVVAYYEKRDKFKKKKAKKTSFIYTCVSNHLKNYITYEMRRNMYDIDSVDTSFALINQIPFFEMYDSLSNDSKEIAKMVLATPHDFLSVSPKIARGKVAERLKENNWTAARIWSAIRTIKQELS